MGGTVAIWEANDSITKTEYKVIVQRNITERGQFFEFIPVNDVPPKYVLL